MEKKVKMTNAEVKGLIDALNGLTSASLPLSPRNWFTLTKNRKELLAASQLLEDSRVEIAKKYADEDDKIGEDDMPNYQKDYLELLNLEVEVKLTPMLMSDLEKDVKKLNGVNNLYLIFEYMITEEKRQPVKKGKK